MVNVGLVMSVFLVFLFIGATHQFPVYPMDPFMEYQVVLVNNEKYDADDVRLSMSIPELGIYRSEGYFDVNDKSKESVVFSFPTYGMQPGEYWVKLSVRSEGRMEDVKWRKLYYYPTCDGCC